MQFSVRTYQAASGIVSESVLEGDSADAVEKLLQGQGMTVLSIAAVRGKLLAKRQAPFNVVLFCEELRTLLSSGMSLIEAIDALCSRNDKQGNRAVLFDIRQRLQEGKAFSAALEMNAFSFSPLLIASIRASERTSRLQDALDEYVAYEKVGQELSRKVVSAAIYPSLVVGFGFLVCVFMISYVVPRFSKVYEDFSQSLSFSTRALMKIGAVAGAYLPATVLVIVIAAVAGIAAYRSGRLQRIFFKLAGRFKTIQHYLRAYQLARIYQTLSMLLRGGYTLVDAIPLAQSLAFDDELRARLVAARQFVIEGKRLSAGLTANGLTDSVTERLLQVGERSGNLAQVMDTISQAYRQEFTLFVERATRLAEPILLMAVGLMIGAIIVLMYMPVFDLANGF